MCARLRCSDCATAILMTTQKKCCWCRKVEREKKSHRLQNVPPIRLDQTYVTLRQKDRLSAFFLTSVVLGSHFFLWWNDKCLGNPLHPLCIFSASSSYLLKIMICPPSTDISQLSECEHQERNDYCCRWSQLANYQRTRVKNALLGKDA